MEESTVPEASMEAGRKETSDNTDHNPITDVNNGDLALLDTTADQKSIISLAEDEENSCGMVVRSVELNVDSFSDKGKKQAEVTANNNESSSLSGTIDERAQDLQAQEDELRELGINVVDQLSLERNVEAAVSSGSLHCSFTITHIMKL